MSSKHLRRCGCLTQASGENVLHYCSFVLKHRRFGKKPRVKEKIINSKRVTDDRMYIGWIGLLFFVTTQQENIKPKTQIWYLGPERGLVHDRSTQQMLNQLVIMRAKQQKQVGKQSAQTSDTQVCLLYSTCRTLFSDVYEGQTILYQFIPTQRLIIQQIYQSMEQTVWNKCGINLHKSISLFKNIVNIRKTRSQSSHTVGEISDTVCTNNCLFVFLLFFPVSLQLLS